MHTAQGSGMRACKQISGPFMGLAIPSLCLDTLLPDLMVFKARRATRAEETVYFLLDKLVNTISDSKFDILIFVYSL